MPTSKSSVDPQTTGVADENHVVTIEVVNSDVDMLSAGNENATTSETNNALSEAKQALREVRVGRMDKSISGFTAQTATARSSRRRLEHKHGIKFTASESPTPIQHYHSSKDHRTRTPTGTRRETTTKTREAIVEIATKT
jgi:hypothetical protein